MYIFGCALFGGMIPSRVPPSPLRPRCRGRHRSWDGAQGFPTANPKLYGSRARAQGFQAAYPKLQGLSSPQTLALTCSCTGVPGYIQFKPAPTEGDGFK